MESFGQEERVTVSEAAERFLGDCKARKLSDGMVFKYKNITSELMASIGDLPLRTVKVDDIRRIRESWELAAISQQKRLEMIRSFFRFCVDSGWIEKNPAKAVTSPKVDSPPTLPYTETEMEKILWAAETVREIHPKMPAGAETRLLGLIMLMRYSGIRISDAVMFKRSQLKNGKLFLRQAKTKQNVWVPLPEKAVQAIKRCDEENEYFFYNGIGKAKTAITEWQQRLKQVYIIAGLENGHSHRLRDTFAVRLLEKGVPLETVSVLLGHRSIRTTERHYAPWVKSRQDILETAVRQTWN
jgi:integrase/recombinase XerD